MKEYQNKDQSQYQNRNDDTDRLEGRMLTGMFRDRKSTENAFNTMQERGYTSDDINLVMSNETRKRHFSGNDQDSELGTKAAEGAGKGSAIGGTVGAVVGVITGGVIGALVGSGMPEERAKLYESGIKDGNIVMGVNPRNVEDAKYFENNWRSNKGEEIHR